VSRGPSGPSGPAGPFPPDRAQRASTTIGKASALNGIKSVQTNAPSAEIDDQTAD